MARLSDDAIRSLGFGAVGTNVMISERAAVYNCANIFIGNNVRIDDFAVLSAGTGGIQLGDHVHVAVGATLLGRGRITMAAFSGLSSHSSIYSSNDDYSGAVMTGPTVPELYTQVMHADVFLGKHVIVGSNSIILPGVTLEEGVAVGSLSLVNRNCAAFGIYVGTPARRVKERKRDLLDLERQFLLEKA